MKKLLYLGPWLLLPYISSYAQTNTCPSMFNRNNGNGQANNCAGVSSTPIASNVSGTGYATVPSGAKTADITFEFASTDSWLNTPPVITASYETVNGTTSPINTFPGPPGVPAIQANGKGQVKYCSYAGASGNGNMPNAGVVSFRLTNPVNASDKRVCTYDLSSGDALIANPTALPLHFYNFTGTRTSAGISLYWVASVDEKVASFSVERSTDGRTFETIHTIMVAANSGNGMADYSYMDGLQGILSGNKIYYRVKELDKDGGFVYTDVSSFTLSGMNPALQAEVHGSRIVVKSPVKQEGFIQLYSTTGQLVRRWSMPLQEGVNEMGEIDPLANIIRVVTNTGTAIARY